MYINLTLKEQYTNTDGFFTTNNKEVIESKLPDEKAKTVNSTNTPVLKGMYEVIYDTNTPDGCTLTSISNEKYFIYENVTQKKNELSCKGYLFKGWEISEDEFNNYLKDKETKTVADFLDKRYVDLVQIQEAWMDFDYDTLRSKTTDELYNQYSMQLDTLKIKGQKNIMKEFVYNDAMITKVTRENNNLTVTIELITNFYDYIVNANNTTIRGHKNDKVRMHYELTFVKSVKKSKDDTCPSCGAKLEDVSSQQCPYCKSTITKDSSSWILSKKEAKGQEWN